MKSKILFEYEKENLTTGYVRLTDDLKVIASFMESNKVFCLKKVQNGQ